MALVASLTLLAAAKETPALAGTITFDPAPLDGSRSSDFPETGPGVNERYQFAGTARNDGTVTVQLSVLARANGVDIPGSLQIFVLPPQATTQFQYDFTYANEPAPSTVGLTFTSDGPLTFIGGAFTFTHATPAVPATPWPASVVLAAALWLASIRSERRT